jgi:hypothetical protein
MADLAATVWVALGGHQLTVTTGSFLASCLIEVAAEATAN